MLSEKIIKAITQEAREQGLEIEIDRNSVYGLVVIMRNPKNTRYYAHALSYYMLVKMSDEEFVKLIDFMKAKVQHD